MAHHKRHRPKHQRAGCLMCKPYKDEREGGTYVEPFSAQRKLQKGDDFNDPAYAREEDAMFRMEVFDEFGCGDTCCESCYPAAPGHESERPVYTELAGPLKKKLWE